MMSPLTRFSVQPLSTMTRRLADIASRRAEPDLVITGARLLSTYSERILPQREIWLSGGRIAAVKPPCAYKGAAAKVYDAKDALSRPASSTRISTSNRAW
jgi:adenine deaminase